MKILITGISGFVGQYLTALLKDQHEVWGITHQPRTPAPGVWFYEADLRDADQVYAALNAIRPDRIFHLAAQASVQVSLNDPWSTLENNIRGQLNLLEAVRKLALDCRILVASSAEVYGKILPEENPVTELQPFRPGNPYSLSKITQDMMAYQYFLSYGLHIIRARAFNHIGPGQGTQFVLPSFATQIVAMEAGEQEAVIHVGNLDARRDFMDVRDVVRAYALMLEHGQAGDVYNVSSGVAHRIADLLEKMRQMSHVEFSIHPDEKRMRPVDVPLIIGSSEKLRQATNWHPSIDIYQSLSDILEHIRQQRKQ